MPWNARIRKGMNRRVAEAALCLGAMFLAGSVHAQTPPDTGDSIRRPATPFRIFDNLYYVGAEGVSAYLLTTSAGLILLDTTYAEIGDGVLSNISQLGFDLASIRYVFITHAHPDHYGGAPAILARTTAAFGASDADWPLIERALGTEAPTRGVVIDDGQTVTLGDTTITFHRTAGHTPGTLSMEFEVVDGDARYTAFCLGGTGLNPIRTVEAAERHVASLMRVREMQTVAVNLSTHPTFHGQIFERAKRLAARRPGDPHPFVAPEDFRAWIETLLAGAEAHLSTLQSQAGSN